MLVDDGGQCGDIVGEDLQVDLRMRILAVRPDMQTDQMLARPARPVALTI